MDSHWVETVRACREVLFKNMIIMELAWRREPIV